VVTITSTSGFSVGQVVRVTDGTATLYSTIYSISTNHSITLANGNGFADDWPGSTGSTATVSALAPVNSPYLTLCWDLANFLRDSVFNTNFFQVTPTPGQGAPPNAGRVAYLFNHYGTVDISNAAADSAALAGANAPAPGLAKGTIAEAVGLQVAIWELEYGSTFTNLQVLQRLFDSSSGTTSKELSDINTWANFYKNDSAGKTETATFLQVTGNAAPQGGQQGMIATGSYNFGNVPKAGSSVSTAIFDSGGGPVTDTLGEQVYDTATVTGVAGKTPTGTVTYYFYNTATPVLGTTTPVSTQTVTLSGGLVPNSATTAPLMAGAYSFIGVYSGDNNYNGSVGAVEPLTINQASSSVSTAIFDSGGGAVTGALGEKVYDTATVSGAPFTPTGTVTNYFYSTATPVLGTTTPVSTQTVTLSGGAVPNSATTAALTAGAYSFIGVYSGDSNYKGAVGAVEPLTINQASPTITTTPGGTVTVGTGVPLTDSATLDGGFNPTGTITFQLFAPAALGGGIVHTEVVMVNGNGTYSTPNGFVPAAGGTYQWVVTYSGDSNNNGAASAFGSEPETAQQEGTSGGTVIISKRLFIASNLGHTHGETQKPHHHHVRQHHKGKARVHREGGPV
jgi:hypothetical protein